MQECLEHLAATRRKGAEVNARGKGDNRHATTNKRAHPLLSPARIGQGSHGTSKVCESDKEKRPPKRKAPHGKMKEGTPHHETDEKVPADAKP